MTLLRCYVSTLLVLAASLTPAALAATQDTEKLSVFITVDMEGISGIAHSEMTSANGAEYERGRDLMLSDVNAAIRGALDAGATEILVNDSHGSMRNLRVEELLEPARLISNNSKRYGMMEGISAEFDAVFFIGYHAKAGHPQGIMAHTGSGRVRDLSVNGVSVGEGGMNAYLAGHYGVPVVLATGDEALTQEISDLAGPLETVAVKRAIRSETAELLHPSVSRQLIRQAASKALDKRAEIKPLAIRAPATVEITYSRTDLAEIASIIPSVTRKNAATVQFRVDTYPEAYAMIRLLYRNLSE